MSATETRREVAIPAAALVHLRHALREETSPLVATHALHGSGYLAGEPILDLLAGDLGQSAEELDEDQFWTGLKGFFERRGWGSLSHERIHPAVGCLVSSDWAEAGETGSEEQPSCAFTCGLLSSVLTHVADRPVAVLQTSCTSRGDPDSRFVYGSQDIIHELYGLLVQGLAFEVAMERL